MNTTVETVRSAVFGAAVGDAVGVPYEFLSLEEMRHRPAIDMIGGGTYRKPAGIWSDDTSMILCTLDRMDESLDYDAIMKAFVAWHSEGAYTPQGDCFDIGRTTLSALIRYSRTHDPLSSGIDDEYSNGNGSLMRIIPAALFADAHDLNISEAVKLSHTLSGLTHAHLRSRIGCGIFTCVALSLIECADKSSVVKGLQNAAEIYSSPEYSSEAGSYRRVLSPRFFSLGEDCIKSSGYVVDTLECALWCLMNTDSYRDCILRAVNFGYDTDTAACIAGALAGLLYGMNGIPARWKATLVNAKAIEAVITSFCKRNKIN